MKTLKIFVFISLLFSLLDCYKDEVDDIKNINVEEFIELLKKGEYKFLKLPPFTAEDIPVLLQYRNENQVITNFPRNMISSLMMPECKLGMYVLWTIEAIRTDLIKTEHVLGSFPSQNPVLGLRYSEELQLVTSEKSHAIAAKAYFDWWNENKHKDFEEFKNIDPLAETDYRWH